MDERQTLEWLCWKPTHPETLSLASPADPPRISLLITGMIMIFIGGLLAAFLNSLLPIGASGIAAVVAAMSVGGLIWGVQWAHAWMEGKRPGKPLGAIALGLVAYGLLLLVFAVAPAALWRRVSHLLPTQFPDVLRVQLGYQLLPEMEATLAKADVQRLLHEQVNALRALDEQVARNMAANDPLDYKTESLRDQARTATAAFTAAVAHLMTSHADGLRLPFEQYKPFAVHPSWERLWGGGPRHWTVLSAEEVAARDKLNQGQRRRVWLAGDKKNTPVSTPAGR